VPRYPIVALDITARDTFQAYRAATPLRTESAPGANVMFVEGS
jgi:hypothetical protein